MTRNLYLERELGRPGWSCPSFMFGLFILVLAIHETFKGIPFAFVSVIGGYIEWSAVSTAIYAPEFKKSLSKKFVYGLPVWLFGAFLVRIGGLESFGFPKLCDSTQGFFLFCQNYHLYVWPTILGATYYPINHEIEDFIKSRELVINAANGLADKLMSQYPQPPEFKFANEFAADVKKGGLIASKIQSCPEISIQVGTEYKLGKYVEVYGNFNALDPVTLKGLDSLEKTMGFKREEAASFYVTLWEIVKARMKEKGVLVDDDSSQKIIVEQITKHNKIL